MNEKAILKDIIERLERIEKVIFDSNKPASILNSAKTLTLAELAKNATVKNGQEQVTLIVGYLEKIQASQQIRPRDVEEGWMDGKFKNKFSPVFIRRAVKEGLVRAKKDGSYDLSQTGEAFFEPFVKEGR